MNTNQLMARVLWAAAVLSVFALVFVTIARAEERQYRIRLLWDANSEPDLAGYKVYYKDVDPGQPGGAPYAGDQALEGPSPIDVPLTAMADPASPEFTLTFPEISKKVYIAVTAYDNESPSLESAFSNEVSKTIPDDWFTGVAPAGVGGLTIFEISIQIKVGQ